jgi:glycosyltransferase involved in cell wall biosynthesis
MALASLARYRENTIRLVKARFGEDIAIYAGSPAYDTHIPLLDSRLGLHTAVRNFYLPRDILLQRLPPIELLRAEVVMLDLNPRLPHVWLVLFVRKLLNKHTILWGHAWSRGGRHAKSESLRSMMRRLASSIVTYTHQQAEELRQLHPDKSFIAAPNSMYHRDQYFFAPDEIRNVVLYVGRLSSAKKPLLLLEAFDRLVQDGDSALELVLVGDGELMEAVRAKATSSHASSRIHILGHIDNYEELAAIYSHAAVSVSPGYAGLSLTQSLGFGVPMVISRDEPHAPEIEAVREGFNALTFRTDSPEDLARTIQEATYDRTTLADGPAIVADCADRYSVEAMAGGLIAAIENHISP